MAKKCCERFVAMGSYEFLEVPYTNLLTSCKLSEHLADIEEECSERMDSLVKSMAKQEGVTEALKAADQMAWVRRMNNIRNRAEEIILNEIVYV